MIRYHLDNLGWFEFEQLCQSLLKAKLGLGVESWGARSDAGRDAYFEGEIRFPTTELSYGKFVFQVKFIEGANSPGAKPEENLYSAINKEMNLIVIRRTTKQFDATCYTLLTNAVLTATMRERIVDITKHVLTDCKIVSIGGQDICDWLDDTPNIRQAFPQLLSIRDIREILEAVVAKPILERSTLLIDQAQELATVFVSTEAYNKALKVLHDMYFLVLVGPPEVGKTTIARIIGLSQMSLGKEVFECHNPDDFYRSIEHSKKQVFIADDAFGSTEYDPTLCNLWAHDLDKIIGRLDKNHWFIWTTRTHILNMALNRMRLQGKAESFPEPANILVDANQLSEIEKALIVYRHAKASHLEEIAKEIVKAYALNIIRNPNFTPERIRRFVKNRLPDLRSRFCSDIKAPELLQTIMYEINEPTKAMFQSFESLPKSHKQFLFCMLDNASPCWVAALKTKYDGFTDKIEQLISFSQVEHDLTDTFIRLIEYRAYSSSLTQIESGEAVTWIHPSLRNLVISYLQKGTSDRRTFLKNCDLVGLKLALAVDEEKREIAPLIFDENDLLSLKENILDRLRNISDNDLVTLLETLDNITTYYHEKKLYSKLCLEMLPNVVREILSHIEKVWRNRETPIELNVLELYFRLTVVAPPILPAPDLTITWQVIYNDARSALEHLTEDTETSMFDILDDHSYMKNLVRFCEIVTKYEPRFLDSIKYLDRIVPVLDGLIDKCAQLSGLEATDFAQDGPDSMQSSGNNLQSLAERLYDARRVVPGLSEQTTEIADQLDELSADVNQQVHEIFPEPEDDYDYSEDAKVEAYFDVQSIFSDL